VILVAAIFLSPQTKYAFKKASRTRRNKKESAFSRTPA
jgi:hypothetical protein